MKTYIYWSYKEMADLIGLTLVSAERHTFPEGDGLLLITDTGEQFGLYHSPDCCESVDLEDITGDLDDIVGSPILSADESTNSDIPPRKTDYEPDSYTWSFYRINTIKGGITVRFYGESNGYYSETATLRQREEKVRTWQ